MNSRPIRKLLSIALLVFFVSSCTSTRVSKLPDLGSSSGVPQEDAHVLGVGDTAIVYTTSGGIIRGEVVEVSSEFVMLGRIWNYGHEESRIESDGIDRIELVKEGSILPFLGLVTIGFVVWSAEQLSHFD